ncbi:Alpha/Beta hydrolase protein [Corynascus similis CBS 632.67]
MARWLTSSLLFASLAWLAFFTDASSAHRQASITLNGNDTTVPIVKVINGSYAGIHSTEYNQDFFLGIPYAEKAPRFTVSQPLKSSWEGVRNATAYPKHCIGYGGDHVGYESSEDCLYLNVVRPAGISDTAGLPVAVWIHGGGLFMGGSADRRYNLSFIVQNSVELGTPMIGVSLNYRLSAFGFPCGKEAVEAGITNLGFKDQRLALRWVSENIAAFGGAPDKVTIWGESSGAESVSAQTLAYGGRDDGLFRGVIAESGYGGVIPRYPGGLNNTDLVQQTYDALVSGTQCRNTTGTPASIDCLRTLPLDDLHQVLNTTVLDGTPLANRFPPVLDGDFIADYPSKQLREGRFPKVRVLIGSNSDEGTSFRVGYGENGGAAGINTDEKMRAAIASIVPPDVEKTAGKTVDQVVDELAFLYPDIQAVGIPSLDKWPVIQPGDDVARDMGAQYRRAAALFGDFMMQFLRRNANLAFAAHGVPSWSYRFDVVLPGQPGYIGATHFQEVAFAFGNTRGEGYAENPFANNTEKLTALARTMSTAWVNFITVQDPNGPNGLGLPGGETWPVYDASAGGGVGQNIVWSEEGSYVEVDSFRAQGINYFIENSVAVFGL